MIPLLPIILGVATLGSGIMQGISSVNQAKKEIKAIQEQTQAKINERAKQARLLMSQQKTSFLKGGVYFDSGSPLEVINETFDTSKADINDMIKDANAQTSNLVRQGKTAFFSSLINSIASAGMGYVLGGGTADYTKQLGSTISNSKVGTAVQNWYNSKRGWTIGDFNTSSNGYRLS